MFEPRHRRSGGSSANRWLVVAGGGLVILAFVARMLLDIGHTKVSDLAAVMRPDTTVAQAPAAVAETATAIPSPPSTDTSSPPPPPTGGGYAVQIGAFGSEANATKLSTRASALGYSAVVIPQPSGASTLYLVRVKGLAGADEARQAADSLQRALGVKAVMVSPGR